MAFNARMHERNIYKNRPNFGEIALEYPEFRKYAVPDERGKIHVDFSDPDALRLVTKLLLKKDFNLNVEIPSGFLIPTIPQRLNYILWIEDLLAFLPLRCTEIKGVDIGTGPCAIFSLLGAKKNSWKFFATESSDEAIAWANSNIEANNLQSFIKVIKVRKNSILDQVLTENDDIYDFCLCNPPFFEDVNEIRKKNAHVKETVAKTAKKDEIVVEGGEVAFVRKLISDSLVYKDRICLYTSMFGKKKSFLAIQKEIKLLKDVTFTTTEFCQGNTIRWGIAWTFLKSIEFVKVKKPKPKQKPPLVYKIPETNEMVYSVKKIFNKIKQILSNLKIELNVLHYSEKVAVLEMKSNTNTWSHQRRKRREMLRQKQSDVSELDASSNSPLLHSSPDILVCETFSEVRNEQDVEIHKISSDSANVPFPDSYRKESKQRNPELKNELVSKNIPIPLVNLSRSDCLESTAVTNNADMVKIFNENGSIHTVDGTESTSSSNLVLKLGENRIAGESGNYNSKNIINETDCTEALNASQGCKRENESFNSSKKIKADFDSASETDSSEVLAISKRYKRKNEFESSTSSKKIKTDFDNAAGVESKFLLFCCLKIIKTKNNIIMEMNCPSNASRETMHQVFQFVKNKLVSINSFL
ncbi:RNA N6-adenosine-methyltransferase mettl16-like [Stegodyphus dumicola]|uniref:RNA N6-adenosine-methyltransferase mettl16-like n=1 Tax=Stegodyphus dumicola TaxID=202533 RepID=UPI0015AF58B7|nr:RNA N6-adenosine-methyltransferase mettl16-like [Stegodyphus dumicola]